MGTWWLALGAAEAVAAGWTDAWQGSRWHIDLEETLPSGVMLAAEENRAFRTRALQMTAVVACPEVTPVGKNNAALGCTFEALSVRAMVRGATAGDSFVETDNRTVADVARRLSAGRVEVTVTQDGRVTAVDLPDLKGTTRWESESRETLRRMAWDLVAGWSLKRPDDWEQGWIEKNTPILRAPLEPGGMGLSRTTHQFSVVEGRKVVVSGGEGSFTAAYVPWESAFAGNSVSESGARGGPNRSSSTGPVTGATADDSGRLSEVRPGTAANTPTDMTFSGEMRSVAVYDDAGRLTERIYTMTARPTASSVGNMQGLSVFSNAHVRRLAPDEKPEVGASTVVAPPGVAIEGVPAWVPVETF